MKKINLLFVSLIFICFFIQSCAPSITTSPPEQPTTGVPTSPSGEVLTLQVMTHDSFAVSTTVIDTFQSENHAKVQFLKAGDAGTALNKAILSKDNPLADVFYSRALDAGIFQPYESPVLSIIPDEFKLDPLNQALPVDYADVCLNYDKSYFPEKNLQPPQNLEDLLKPQYKGLLVVENPAISSPGLAFLLTTIAEFGEDGYLDYWKGLLANDVEVVDGWETAYYTEFSGSSGKGPRPIVVSYDSSPAFEVIFAEQPIQEPPTAAIVSDKSCFRQIEFVGILKGTKELELAQKWVDFMLSTTFQEDMPLQMAVFPVNPNAKLNDTFKEYLVLPQETGTISPQEIAANRDKWIEAWTETVLK
jgi:thiamine transport system substrate-binding protein